MKFFKRGSRKLRWGTTLLGLAAILWLWQVPLHWGAAGIRVAPETTHITTPLRADGQVDYIAALNARLSEGVTPENNAATLLIVALKDDTKPLPDEYYERLGVPRPPADRKVFVNFDDYLQEQELDSDTRFELDEEAYDLAMTPWDKEDYPYVAAWMDSIQEPLEMIVEASGRERFYSPLVARTEFSAPAIADIGLDSYRLQRTVRAIRMRAMRRLAEGNFDGFMADLRAAGNLGRLLQQAPFFLRKANETRALGGLQRTCVAAAQSRLLNAAQLGMLRQQLNRFPSRIDTSEMAGIDERYSYLATIADLAHGKSIVVHSDKSPVDRLEVHPSSLINWNPALERANDWFDRLEQATSLTTSKARIEAIRQVAEERDAFLEQENSPPIVVARHALGGWRGRSSRWATYLWTVAHLPTEVVHLHAETIPISHKMADAAIALEIYRLNHGEYPNELSLLVPDLLAEVPQEIVANADIFYEKTSAGYRLISRSIHPQLDPAADILHVDNAHATIVDYPSTYE